MVEFAIALPILLALLYGILETGRFLFLYSSGVTASRQAVRYGATTGDGNEGERRYKDCDGIRATANAAGYLGRFDSITLQHDTGPGTIQFIASPGTGRRLSTCAQGRQLAFPFRCGASQARLKGNPGCYARRKRSCHRLQYRTAMSFRVSKRKVDFGSFRFTLGKPGRCNCLSYQHEARFFHLQ